MNDFSGDSQKIVGFESQPILQSTSNMKTLGITGACVVGAVILFCSMTGTKFTHKPIGTVGGNPDGTKYVAPWKNKPSQSPEEVQQFVKDYMQKHSVK